jgi:hypothetical protein
MKLTISGRPIGRGVDQPLLREAAKYFMGILMQNDLTRLESISVQINLEPNMSDTYKNDALSGWLDDRFRPNNFFVDMDNALSYKGSLIGLGHELTHVKQMAMGERQESWDGQTMRWFGIPYDPSSVHYYDLPWEIEAHGREYGLYDRFVQAVQNVEWEPSKVLDSSNRLKAVG